MKIMRHEYFQTKIHVNERLFPLKLSQVLQKNIPFWLEISSLLQSVSDDKQKQCGPKWFIPWKHFFMFYVYSYV